MPPKLTNLKPREVVSALEKAGFFIHETGGSHLHLKALVHEAEEGSPHGIGAKHQVNAKSSIRQWADLEGPRAEDKLTFGNVQLKCRGAPYELVVDIV